MYLCGQLLLALQTQLLFDFCNFFGDEEELKSFQKVGVMEYTRMLLLGAFSTVAGSSLLVLFSASADESVDLVIGQHKLSLLLQVISCKALMENIYVKFN